MTAGKLRDEAKQAWDSGVVMDIGHGAGSFSFETAEALMSAGRISRTSSPPTFTKVSIHGPMFDMPTCLSKFMAVGDEF